MDRLDQEAILEILEQQEGRVRWVNLVLKVLRELEETMDLLGHRAILEWLVPMAKLVTQDQPDRLDHKD